MNKHFPISLSILIAITLTITNRVKAEENYALIAEATVPGLIDSAQSIGKFTDQVSPGSSLFLAGGVVALSFQLQDIILSSEIRVLLYADSSGNNPAPLIAFIATPAGRGNGKTPATPTHITLNHFQFPSKKIGDQLFIAENANLLNAIKKLPPPPKSDADLTLKLYPEKYISLCKGTIPAFEAKLKQEFSKGRKPKTAKESEKMQDLDALLKQCQAITLTLKSDRNTMDLDIAVQPKPETEMAKALQTFNGELSQQDIIALSQKITKSQDIVITDQIINSLSFVLSAIFANSDTDQIAEKLCKFKITSDRSVLNINLELTATQTKEILSAAGVIEKK